MKNPAPMPAPARALDDRFAPAVTLLFLVVVALGMATHEIWRDEWQAWLLARDSASVPALLHNMRYEGHPPTWHLLLFGLSRLTRSIRLMQVVHLVIATAAIWILLRHAPFTRLQKALIAFGYFPAYEYAVISRSYALGMLALFGACAAWNTRHRSYVPLGLWLSLLAFSNVYGAILALAFGCAVFVECVFDDDVRKAVRARWRSAALAGTLVAGSVLLSTALAQPPDDAFFQGNAATSTAGTPARAAASVGFMPPRALVPVPRFEAGIPVWGQTMIVDDPGLPGAAVAGALLLFGLALFAARTVGGLALMAAGSTGLLVFAYAFHYGYLRHQGHLMLLVIAAAWLALLPGMAPRLPGVPARVLERITRIGGRVFTLVLAVHAATFAILYTFDLRYPFTPGLGAARALAAAGVTEGVPLAATQVSYAATLAGYLDVRIHYLDGGETGTFVVWGEGRARTPRDSIVARTARLVAPDQPVVLLATERPLPEVAPPAGVRVEAIAHDAPVHLAPEFFWLYRITRR